MDTWIVNTFGLSESLARGISVGASLLVVLILIALFVFILKRLSGARLSTGRGRQPRIAVMDATNIDTRRRLLLVRRDNVEHLILVGGSNDLVIEPGIIRGAPIGQSTRSQTYVQGQALSSAPVGTSAGSHLSDTGMPPPAFTPSSHVDEAFDAATQVAPQAAIRDTDSDLFSTPERPAAVHTPSPASRPSQAYAPVAAPDAPVAEEQPAPISASHQTATRSSESAKSTRSDTATSLKERIANLAAKRTANAPLSSPARREVAPTRDSAPTQPLPAQPLAAAPVAQAPPMVAAPPAAASVAEASMPLSDPEQAAAAPALLAASLAPPIVVSTSSVQSDMARPSPAAPKVVPEPSVDSVVPDQSDDSGKVAAWTKTLASRPTSGAARAPQPQQRITPPSSGPAANAKSLYKTFLAEKQSGPASLQATPQTTSQATPSAPDVKSTPSRQNHRVEPVIVPAAQSGDSHPVQTSPVPTSEESVAVEVATEPVSAETPAITSTVVSVSTPIVASVMAPVAGSVAPPVVTPAPATVKSFASSVLASTAARSKARAEEAEKTALQEAAAADQSPVPVDDEAPLPEAIFATPENETTPASTSQISDTTVADPATRFQVSTAVTMTQADGHADIPEQASANPDPSNEDIPPMTDQRPNPIETEMAKVLDELHGQKNP
ncbi:flagellar biosynthetic protein FliO [Roseibium sp. CAU 1637]|uniref:Flagellar biosynthetic protein FliO n=1 Tax=Roseibium limicola TaxID=2816037 RepID=A0A939EM50_9HYPH|nr:flagellar biosynthetic protein FliO [Roseibium limicola]MBO0344967.1 flagellar biosynthetic protein FliO [Roseibium limicola]